MKPFEPDDASAVLFEQMIVDMRAILASGLTNQVDTAVHAALCHYIHQLETRIGLLEKGRRLS